MDAGDCLVCAAARETGSAECQGCGQVFVAETIDPNAPAYYFGAPSVRPEDLAAPVKQTKRRFGLFRR